MKREQDRQMREVQIITRILLDRYKYFRVATEEYYYNHSLQAVDVCNMCPSYHGEKSSPVRRSMLIDQPNHKGLIWATKSAEITTKYCHKLVMFMWVHHIISIHWSNASVKKGGSLNKEDIVYSYEKKSADSNNRMNHRDDSC